MIATKNLPNAHRAQMRTGAFDRPHRPPARAHNPRYPARAKNLINRDAKIARHIGNNPVDQRPGRVNRVPGCGAGAAGRQNPWRRAAILHNLF